MRPKIKQRSIPKGLLSLDFYAGRATPCNFKHQDKELFVTVHGDDFTVIGPMKSLEWLQKGLEQAWEIKSEFLGPRTEGCVEEMRVLNRVLRWTSKGLEYEPDQRHADLIIEQAGVSNCKPVSTPCCSDAEYDENKRIESWFL